MKNNFKIFLFIVVSIFLYGSLISDYNALVIDTNYSMTIDYDYYYEHFVNNYQLDNIIDIIDKVEEENTNKSFALIYRPNEGLYLYTYGLNSNSNLLETYYWFNQTNNLGYLTSQWTFVSNTDRYCLITIDELSMSGNIDGKLEQLSTCLSSSSPISYSGSLGYNYYQNRNYQINNYNDYNTWAPGIVVYTSSNTNFKYNYSHIVSSTQNGSGWGNVNVVADNDSTSYSVGDDLPTFYSAMYDTIVTPPVNYNLGTGYFNFTDYIYNQINWLNIKTDIINAINVEHNNSTNQLLINWVEGIGIDVLILDYNSKIPLNLTLGLRPTLYNGDVLVNADMKQGVSFSNIKYLRKTFAFDTYFPGQIYNYVNQFLNVDLDSYSDLPTSYNYNKYSAEVNSPYGFNKEHSKIYPIYFDENYFEFKYVDDEENPYYYGTIDFIIDESSNPINLLTYDFKSIYDLYDFTTTNGAGSNANVCRPGTDCYFNTIVSDIEVKGPLDSLLLIPLRIINKVTEQMNSTCTPITLTLPFINSNIYLPCIRTLFETWGIMSMIEVFCIFINAYLLYRYLVYLYNWFEDLFAFEVDMDFIVPGGKRTLYRVRGDS